MRLNMLAALLGGLFELVFEVFAALILYWLGRIVVTILTFGKLACDGYDRESTWHDPWHVTGRDEDGLYLTAEATTVVGLVAAIIMVVGYFFWK